MPTTDLGLTNTYSALDDLPAADVNTLADTLEWVAAGAASVDVAGTGDITLSAAQYQAAALTLTGILTGVRNVILPAKKLRWTITNSTTGAFSLTVKTAAGAGVVIPQGYRAVVLGDGANILLLLMVPVTPVVFTQTYATADPTLGAYTADVESAAYTGAADGEAKLADLNALRVAYENLRAHHEDLAQAFNAVVDELQRLKLLG